jgi:2-hydroxychromene-2-carboxylate isomerase
MTQIVEFLFDFGSPTTYLAHKRILEITPRTGIQFDYVPVLLGGIFKASGNASPAMVPAKGRYMNADMARFAARHGVSLATNPFFPVNTIHMMRGAEGLRGTPRYAAYIDAMFDAMWCTPVNMGDMAVLAITLEAAGFDSAEFAAMIADEAVKERLKANTEAAVARGVFGAPTFYVGDAMFFGQDRLDWIEEAALAS